MKVATVFSMCGVWYFGLGLLLAVQCRAGELSPDQVVAPAVSGGQFGRALAAGDPNGDGSDDLAVVSGLWPLEIALYMSAGGSLETNAGWTAEMGYGDLCFCDVNADGFEDLAAQFQSPTLAYGISLWQGSSTGLSVNADWTYSLNHQHAYFGYALDDAGDVNGDGFNDIVVGEYGYSAGGLVNEGAVYLFTGSASGLSNAPAFFVKGAAANAWMGYSVSGVGDVNGDGFDDFAVGYASGYKRAEVFFGSSNVNTIASNRWSVTADQAFGALVAAAGDVNADGYADWLGCCKEYESSAARSDTGVACLFLGAADAAGREETLEDAAWMLEGYVNGDYLGTDAAGIGDFNRDGFDDVVISAPRNGRLAWQGGTVYLYYGQSNGLANTLGEVYSSASQYANLGHAVCAGADFNGDGGWDWVASAPFYNSSDGICYLFNGSAPPAIYMPSMISWADYGTNAVSIAWLNPSNLTCRVYRSANLSDPFEPLDGTVHAGSATNYWIDPELLPQAYYRVKVIESP